MQTTQDPCSTDYKPKLVQGNPSWEAVQELALRFELLSEMAPGVKVDMGESQVQIIEQDPNLCGTTACHAGWYALLVHNNDFKTNYKEGKKFIAKHLGFDGEDSLIIWAKKNPEIWGNDDGADMFYGEEAFGLQDVNPTLKLISEHWMAVSKRLFDIQVPA